jgi:RNA polymerase sigma-70 factor (ECF subfamily)
VDLPPEVSDAQLWNIARDGDHRAFGALFERHVQQVYSYCFRRLGSREAAEDAAQAVFVELWRKRKAVMVGESLRPYLFGLANNVARNASRSNRRYTNAIARLPAPRAVADHAESVAAGVDVERQMHQVLAALRGLRRAEQDVLAMCDWSGLTYEEAAAALGIPVGTVRSRLSRARQHVRERLGVAGAVDRPVTGRPDESRGDV